MSVLMVLGLSAVVLLLLVIETDPLDQSRSRRPEAQRESPVR